MKNMTPREQRLFDILTAAAEAGEICPTNGEICTMMGINSVGCPPEIMNKLIARGLISVERFAMSRIVTIVASGKSTAGKPGKPHFRAGNKGVPVSPLLSEEQSTRFRQKLTDYIKNTGCTGSRLSTIALGHSTGVNSIMIYSQITRKVATKFRSVMDRYPNGLDGVPLSEALSAQEMRLNNERLEARRGEGDRRHAEHVRQCEAAHRERHGDAPFGKSLSEMVA